MPANGGTTYREKIIAVVLVLFTLVTLLGVNGAVAGLQRRVDDLERQVATIDEIEARIDKNRQDIEEIAHVRQDILEAICIANARDPRDAQRCRDSAFGR